MAGKYHGYTEYREPSVEWLRSIPRHWIETSLKRYCKVTDGSHHSPKIQSDGMPFVSVTDVGVNDIDFEDSKKITREDYLRLVQEGCKPNVGDVLLTKDGTIGRAAIVSEDFPDFVILSSLGLLTPNGALSNVFLYYYLISGVNVDQMNSMIHGSALRRMTISKINSLLITIPPVEEQEKIANFLDHEAAKIDTLIKKQQQLIKLLQEKRQAVISHAVTKGLDPNAPMRDSGVEWLGEVPEGWVVGNMDHALNAIGDVDHYMPKSVDKGIPYVMTGDLEELASSIKLRGCKQVNHNDYLKLSKKIKSSKGDVIMARYATIGTVSYIDVDADFLVSYSCVTIKPNLSKVVGLYLFYYFKSDAFLQGIQSQVNTNTQGNVGVNDLKKIKVALPTLDEQSKIIEYLQLTIRKLDSISDRSKAAIALAQERRTALISAAVTGKIDVRNWQAPEPSDTHTKDVAA